MPIIDLTEAGFSALAGESRPVLLDFYADWCAPCRATAPAVEALGESRADLLVGRVNVDTAPAIAEQFGVMSIPTFVLLRDGQEVSRSVGAKSRAELEAMV